MRADGTIPQLTHCRSPRERQYPHSCLPALLVAWDDHLDREICGRMCTLSTEQNMHYQEEDTPLLHPGRSIHVTIQHHSFGPHHSATQSKWPRCNTYHSRSGMLLGRYFPPLPHNHHQRRSHSAIPQTPVPVVRSPIKSNIGSRPSFYVPLCVSINHEAKHQTEYQYSISPTD